MRTASTTAEAKRAAENIRAAAMAPEYARERHERALAAVQERLEPDRFEALRAAGRGLSLDDAIADLHEGSASAAVALP